ncbi:MAG: hexose kinase [Micropruina sp.]|uniref:1-phosphofructokinase family hexose kinase n=1 Tax=Micropruina sp. TaxID=2737536 RepID=UPI0039E6F5ED
MTTVHCLTPNPALDITYRLDSMQLHAVNRVHSVEQRPGGKGVNVARVVAAHGLPVAGYGFLGGRAGETLAELLAEYAPGVVQRWTPVPAETRRTIAVVDAADTTMLNEPGRPVTDADWEALTRTLVDACRPGDVVTISGSLPAGTVADHLTGVIAAARAAGAVVIADTSGEALLTAAAAGADVVKPNRDEIVEATGAADVRDGIRRLLDHGCGAVVASMGADGMLLGAADGFVTARLNRVLQGNPTGAGDAVVAALAHGLALSSPSQSRFAALGAALADAVAWSAAAVLSPVAGEIDQRQAARLALDVLIQE